jgi:hypothetical protein
MAHCGEPHHRQSVPQITWSEAEVPNVLAHAVHAHDRILNHQHVEEAADFGVEISSWWDCAS